MHYHRTREHLDQIGSDFHLDFAAGFLDLTHIGCNVPIVVIIYDGDHCGSDVGVIDIIISDFR